MLEAARKVFAEQGLEASTNEIARRAAWVSRPCSVASRRGMIW